MTTLVMRLLPVLVTTTALGQVRFAPAGVWGQGVSSTSQRKLIGWLDALVDKHLKMSSGILERVRLQGFKNGSSSMRTGCTVYGAAFMPSTPAYCRLLHRWVSIATAIEGELTAVTGVKGTTCVKLSVMPADGKAETQALCSIVPRSTSSCVIVRVNWHERLLPTGRRESAERPKQELLKTSPGAMKATPLSATLPLLVKVVVYVTGVPACATT